MVAVIKWDCDRNFGDIRMTAYMDAEIFIQLMQNKINFNLTYSIKWIYILFRE